MFSTEQDMSDDKVSVLHTLGNKKFHHLCVSQEFLLDTLREHNFTEVQFENNPTTPQTSICMLVMHMERKKHF